MLVACPCGMGGGGLDAGHNNEGDWVRPRRVWAVAHRRASRWPPQTPRTSRPPPPPGRPSDLWHAT